MLQCNIFVVQCSISNDFAALLCYSHLNEVDKINRIHLHGKGLQNSKLSGSGAIEKWAFCQD
jgi:hypothetical protein